jgi:Flp pilus assembly protein TadD
MDEQQHHDDALREAKSPIAKMLLGKVFSHKLFSERTLFWTLLGCAFLLPVFFIPGTLIAPEFAKMLLLEVAVLIGVFVWAAGRLRDGSVTIPKSFLLLLSVLLVVQFVVAAIVSPAPLASFIGSGYDIGTVNIFVVLVLLMFLSSVVFSNRDRILSLYASLVFAGALALLYHLLRQIFGTDLLDFGVFTSNISSPIGKWNDFASLIGGLVLLILSTLYFFPQNKTLRVPAFLLLLLSLGFLLIINFTILWIILAVFLAVLVGLAIYEGEAAHTLARLAAGDSGTHTHKPVHKRMAHHLPIMATVFLVISIFYGAGITNLQWGNNNQTIGNFIGKVLHAPAYSEVVLTPQFTISVVRGVLADSPFFGTGPNRFSSGFLMHKTSEVNRSPFWDSTFNFGLGHIPTYFGTTGLIGSILWLLFIVILIMKAQKIKALLLKDRIGGYLAFSLFFLTLYFWSLAIFYLPNISIFALAFLFAGALVAFLVAEGVLGRYEIPFTGNSLRSFVLTPIVIMVLVGVVASSVLLYRETASLFAFRDAQLALEVGNIDAAGLAVIRANQLMERDLYHRVMSNIALGKLSRLSVEELTTEEFQSKANQLITEARMHAERAVTLDPTNFENYLQLGSFYDVLGSLGIQNTKEPASLNYAKALELNPRSPRVLFVIARLEFLAGDREKTKEYLQRTLLERPNFLEALSFLVQLELSDKNPAAAVAALQKGVNVEPTNFLLRFALGYLHYLNGNIEGAINEFQATVLLNPVYADAKYFLGLSYARSGRTEEAIAQFTDVQELNPESKEVANILRNLHNGRDPFASPYVAPTQPVEDALEGLIQNGGQTDN